MTSNALAILFQPLIRKCILQQHIDEIMKEHDTNDKHYK